MALIISVIVLIGIIYGGGLFGYFGIIKVVN